MPYSKLKNNNNTLSTTMMSSPTSARANVMIRERSYNNKNNNNNNIVFQVQPDMEELDANMEDNEGAEEEKEEVNLGKLQFSLDYDFQKNEVKIDSIMEEWHNFTILIQKKNSAFLIHKKM